MLPAPVPWIVPDGSPIKVKPELGDMREAGGAAPLPNQREHRVPGEGRVENRTPGMDRIHKDFIQSF